MKQCLQTTGANVIGLARVQSVGKSHWAALQAAIRVGVDIATGSEVARYDTDPSSLARTLQR